MHGGSIMEILGVYGGVLGYMGSIGVHGVVLGLMISFLKISTQCKSMMVQCKFIFYFADDDL